MITDHLEFANAWLLFLALFALYSPVAALSSYIPYVEGYSKTEQRRLAVGLFLNVLLMSMIALWVGEPLLELLGISTAALSATGGIALLLAAVPMMTGATKASEPEAGTIVKERPPWRSIVFTPLTFPLTFGGTTFGFFVAYRAESNSWTGAIGLSVAALAYAAVTGITLYAASHLGRRISPQAGAILEKIAGILLTAIAVILLASGGTRLVVDVLQSL
ncbi:MarC family protein [Streptomyces sp. Midd1]|uniref:MarC family protein n=1 Tax=Streptomyces sp. Midd3 TaxID=3161191 RepID=UPI0034DB3CDA